MKHSTGKFVFTTFLATVAFIGIGCNRASTVPAEPGARLSSIKVDVEHGGPAVVTTASAEFRILPSGYVQAALL
jgi:hypothetical protein